MIYAKSNECDLFSRNDERKIDYNESKTDPSFHEPKISTASHMIYLLTPQKSKKVQVQIKAISDGM